MDLIFKQVMYLTSGANVSNKKISVSVHLLLMHLILYLWKKISRADLFQPQDAGVDTETAGLNRGQPESSCSVLALKSNTLFWIQQKLIWRTHRDIFFMYLHLHLKKQKMLKQKYILLSIGSQLQNTHFSLPKSQCRKVSDRMGTGVTLLICKEVYLTFKDLMSPLWFFCYVHTHYCSPIKITLFIFKI